MSVTIWYSVGCRNRYRPKGLVSSLAVRVTRTTPPRDHWLGEGAAVASPVCSVVTSTFLDLHRNFGGLSIEVVWSQILAIPNPGAGNPPSLLTFISTVEPSPRAKAAQWRRRFKIVAVTVSLLLLLGLVLFAENGLSYLIQAASPCFLRLLMHPMPFVPYLHTPQPMRLVFCKFRVSYRKTTRGGGGGWGTLPTGACKQVRRGASYFVSPWWRKGFSRLSSGLNSLNRLMATFAPIWIFPPRTPCNRGDSRARSREGYGTSEMMAPP
jgi:hypothetical protein